MSFKYIRVSTKDELENNSFQEQEKEILKKDPSPKFIENNLQGSVFINFFLITYWIF